MSSNVAPCVRNVCRQLVLGQRLRSIDSCNSRGIGVRTARSWYRRLTMLDIDVVLFYGRGGGETHEQQQPTPDAGDHRTGPSSTGGGYFPVVPSRRSVLLRLGQGSGEIRDAACAFLRRRHGDRRSQSLTLNTLVDLLKLDQGVERQA